MSGNGINWAICKSASRSRQITMPAPHHSSFLQAGCPSCRPTNSVKALKANKSNTRTITDMLKWTQNMTSTQPSQLNIHGWWNDEGDEVNWRCGSRPDPTVYSAGVKDIAAELIQYLVWVGGGPSSNTWPRWAPHCRHVTSVRLIPAATAYHLIITDHFSGPGRATGTICLCTWHAGWFILTLSRLSLKVKVHN